MAYVVPRGASSSCFTLNTTSVCDALRHLILTGQNSSCTGSVLHSPSINRTVWPDSCTHLVLTWYLQLRFFPWAVFSRTFDPSTVSVNLVQPLPEQLYFNIEIDAHRSRSGESDSQYSATRACNPITVHQPAEKNTAESQSKLFVLQPWGLRCAVHFLSRICLSLLVQLTVLLRCV